MNTKKQLCGYHISSSEECIQQATCEVKYKYDKKWTPVCDKHAKITMAYGWAKKPQIK